MEFDQLAGLAQTVSTELEVAQQWQLLREGQLLLSRKKVAAILRGLSVSEGKFRDA